MANTKDLRIKISSTVKTQQTTKAMKMVSAAKLRRAQNAITNARPYAQRLYGVIHRIAETHRVEHPLLAPAPKQGRVLLVVLTSDRGLCGGFNNNIIKYAWNWYKQNQSNYEQIDFFYIGRKGSDVLKKRGAQAVETITNLAHDIKYPLAAGVAERLWTYYLNGEYSEIRMVYNEFKSAISQKVVDEQLLPIVSGQAQTEMPAENPGGFSKDFIFEPKPEMILDQLLMKHFAVQVYRAMQESLASEHGSRMAAMENATKNAGEMIRNLTLFYNKVRQAAITTELIEITSGAEALKG